MDFTKLLAVISDLYRRVRRLPRMHWGTVTNVSPLMVRRDGPPGTDPVRVDTTIVGLVPGDRVRMDYQDQRYTVIGRVGGPGGGGDPGPPGPPNVLSIGTVSTVTPGDPATAQITGTSPAQVLSLGIPAGFDGADGMNGADGADGAKWLSGGGPPSNGAGQVGDFYLRSNGDVYEKTGASRWDLAGINLHGADGADGADGAEWFYGSAAPPGATGSIGDYYLRSNGLVYVKTGASTWSSTGINLTGPAGATITAATQATVNTGTNTTQFVNASTLRNRSYAPYAVAAGRFEYPSAINTGTGQTLNVTFPTGRFTQAPVVTATVRNAARLNAAVINPETTTGFSVRLDNFSGGTAGASGVHWHAIQMSSTSAEG